MSRFTPWDSRPMAIVLRVGVDYDQTVVSQRERASLAAAFANTWIFNAATKSRKEYNFVGPMPRKTFALSPDSVVVTPGDYRNFKCITVTKCANCDAISSISNVSCPKCGRKL